MTEVDSMITLEKAERLVADEILKLEQDPDGSRIPLLLLVTNRGIVRHLVTEGFPPKRGETWTGPGGTVWRCKAAFTVWDSKVKVEREVRFMMVSREGQAPKEVTA